MPTEAIKIRIPAITDEDYDVLVGALRQLRVKSLRSWALQRGHAVSTTYAAVRGQRGKKNGTLSRQIQKQLRKTLYAKAE